VPAVKQNLAMCLFVLAALVSGAGCLFTVTARPVYVVEREPPPEPVERAPRPRIGYVWVHGAWEWSGSDWRWKDGYWQRDRGNEYLWIDGRWERHGHRYHWVEGRWQRAAGGGGGGGRIIVQDHGHH
jgi:hypothetical protein